MSFADIFILRHGPKPQKGSVVPAGKSPGEGTVIFLTPKSLLSFPVASGTAVMLWKVAQRVFGQPAGADWVAVLISLVIGAIIFMVVIGDSQVRPKSLSQWIVAVVVGLVNSLYLATSVLGLLGRPHA